ncbi:MAG: HAD family phosphatase [Candidatus Levybacteria bacterium]|nr:HAD family phosphatase [Candidatus Levybacteria bacterium]
MKTVHIDVKNVKAAIFDMDGTMVDNNEFHKKAFQKFCQHYGFTLTEEDFMKNYSGRSNKQLMPKVLGHDLSDEEIKKYAEEKESLYRDIYAAHIKPVEGLHELLAKLQKKHIKIAIATGAIQKNREFILNALQLVGTFDVIVGDEEVKSGKPHPDIFLKTAEKLGVKPENCIVFEDAPAGIAAAKKAGMKVIVLTTSHSKDALKDADLLIENFSQLELV